MVYLYSKKFPVLDEIVVCKVINISEYGIEVVLNEYDNIKGFINCAEVSRKKKVNMNKLLVVGKDVLLNVIKVDENKKFIDLSKRTVSQEDIQLFEEKHKCHMQLYKLFVYIYMKINFISNLKDIIQEKLCEFMTFTLWNLQEKYSNEYIIQQLFTKNFKENIFSDIDFSPFDTDYDKIKNIIFEYLINKNFITKNKLTEEIRLSTLNIDGLNDIKYCLNLSEFNKFDYSQDFKISINYSSDGLYIIIIEEKEINQQNQDKININELLKYIKFFIKERAELKNINNKININ